MTKLDHTFSSLIEIDSHALHTVTGGIYLLGDRTHSAAARPSKAGEIACQLALLGCIALGPDRPAPGDGNRVRPPSPGQPKPPAGAPLTPGPGKANLLLH
jgi:hypothetical protein